MNGCIICLLVAKGVDNLVTRSNFAYIVDTVNILIFHEVFPVLIGNLFFLGKMGFLLIKGGFFGILLYWLFCGHFRRKEIVEHF